MLFRSVEVCEPDPHGVVAGLQRAFQDAPAAVEMASRGRAHVIAELMNDRPAAPPPRVGKRAVAQPTVALEIPANTTGTSAETAKVAAAGRTRRDGSDLVLAPAAANPSGADMADAQTSQANSPKHRQPARQAR